MNILDCLSNIAQWEDIDTVGAMARSASKLLQYIHLWEIDGVAYQLKINKIGKYHKINIFRN